jgi:hypothetical protein
MIERAPSSTYPVSMVQERSNSGHARAKLLSRQITTGRLVSVVLVAAIAGTATNVAAEVLPLSDIFLVHEPSIGADQSKPHVVGLPRGGFLAAWTAECEDACSSGVPLVGRAFDANGVPRYPVREFSAPYPSGARHVQFALQGRRRLVAVWSNPDRDGNDEGIVGAIFRRSFQPVGTEFPINARHTLGKQHLPTVAVAAGGFLVAWSDYGDDIDTPPLISAQRFDKVGNRIGDEINLAVTPIDYPFYPEAAALQGSRSGDVIVVWESRELEVPESTFDIAAKFIDRNGNVSERFVLNTPEAPLTHQGNPSVAVVDVGFIVAWSSFDTIDQKVDIYARRFDNSGQPLGDEVRVNSFTDGPQLAPVVTASSDGSFVVLWSSGRVNSTSETQDGDGSGLYGQAFASNGARIGSEFQVSTKTKGSQGVVPNTTTAAFVNPTDFVVLWDDNDNQLSQVYGRRFRLSASSRLCGDNVGTDLTIGVQDVSRVLRAAVGLTPCMPCKCDIDGSSSITVADAQATLRSSVSSALLTTCPACE